MRIETGLRQANDNDDDDNRVAKAGQRSRGACTPLRDGCAERWSWNALDRSPEVRVRGENRETVLFHPTWSNGASGVRGTRSMRHGVHYWEIRISSRLFGTSMMFGVASPAARLHVDAFVNLLGEDEHSWALSHKGFLWHGGKARPYTKPFPENECTTVGLLLDRDCGTLTYFKDGHCLGVAFTGLDQDRVPALYPAVCSTAAKTQMTLTSAARSFSSLQDRCRAVIAALLRSQKELAGLPLPHTLKRYIGQSLPRYTMTPRSVTVETKTFSRTKGVVMTTDVAALRHR